MGRRATSPARAADREYGESTAVWATRDSRDILYEIAHAEERAAKIVLRRALAAYAEASPDYQRWLREQRQTKQEAKQPAKEAA